MNNTKKFILGTVLGLGLASVVLADGVSTNKLVLVDERSRVSYAIGMMTGQQWKMQHLDFDINVYAQGIKDSMAGGKTLLTPEESQQMINNFRNEFNSKQQMPRAEQAAKNKAIGEAFLATNKNNPGVITLPDGLQYLIVSKGSGVIPAAGDMLTVHYRGTLVDGTEFDSSIKRGNPFQFRIGVDRVITGWTEALQKMSVGSKWRLFIPADLAYGEQGRQGIPPNAVLIFEVELLDAKTPPAPAVPATPLTSDIIKVPSAEERNKGAQIEVIKTEDAAKAPKKSQ